MKKFFLLGLCFAQIWAPRPARADLFGGDLPLLAEIVMNTLQTLRELEAQTNLAKAEMEGLKDKITRMKTIAELVQPSSWEEWKSPEKSLEQLKKIYYTLPKEYRSNKADAIEQELSKAMAEIGKLSRQPLYSGQCNYIDKVFMFSSSPRSHAFMASAGVMSPIAP